MDKSAEEILTDIKYQNIELKQTQRIIKSLNKQIDEIIKKRIEFEGHEKRHNKTINKLRKQLDEVWEYK